MSIQSMTSLGRVGRILAGTIDGSSLSNERDAQSSSMLRSVDSSTDHNTLNEPLESADLKEIDKKSNLTVLQGK